MRHSSFVVAVTFTALAALHGCSAASQNLGDSERRGADGGTGTQGEGSSSDGGTGKGPRVDAGPEEFYASIGSSNPTDFFGPKANVFRDGHMVIAGQAIIDGKKGDALPTVLDLTLKVAAKEGSYKCGIGGGDTTAEVDESPDSNAALKERLSTLNCAIEVTSIGAVGERIVGTFSASVGGTSYYDIKGGVFDLTRGADR